MAFLILIKIVGEKAHTPHHSQQPSSPGLLHLTQPAERKNDLTATLHSGVDVREVSGLHKQKTKPNSNGRTVEPLSFFLQQPVRNFKKNRVPVPVDGKIGASGGRHGRMTSDNYHTHENPKGLLKPSKPDRVP
eukprot:scaffold6927_cov149-Skeletonema_dohrnii-CCMP3373.AAC.2